MYQAIRHLHQSELVLARTDEERNDSRLGTWIALRFLEELFRARFYAGRMDIEQGEQRGEQRGQQREALSARQQTLIMLLRKKFGKVPDRIVQRIEATTTVEQLDAWLEAVITAAKLADMGIRPLE